CVHHSQFLKLLPSAINCVWSSAVFISPCLELRGARFIAPQAPLSPRLEHHYLRLTSVAADPPSSSLSLPFNVSSLDLEPSVSVSVVSPSIGTVLKLHQGRREQLHLERLYMGIVIILVKLFWKKPEQRYKYESIQDDLELGSSNFPVVLIQIPMFNEKEVYKVSIGAACNLSWPADRLVIQVLDNSIEPTIKEPLKVQYESMHGKHAQEAPTKACNTPS
ncbi:hypothetical protein HN873_066252, partial [Arachis hypogaea]